MPDQRVVSVYAPDEATGSHRRNRHRTRHHFGHPGSESPLWARLGAHTRDRWRSCICGVDRGAPTLETRAELSSCWPEDERYACPLRPGYTATCTRLTVGVV